jgi:hypothetical protein
MSSEVLAALLGAVAAGLLTTLVSVFDHRRNARATMVAIASEVDSICRLIHHQDFLPYIRRQVAAIRAGSWDGRGMFIDIRGNYYSVFEALSPQLGKLEPAMASKVVHFYASCKSIMDMTRPDGRMAGDADPEFVKENLIRAEALFTNILALGDDIVRSARVGRLAPGDRG